MTDVHEARVEAAAESEWGRYNRLAKFADIPERARSAYMDYARADLAAADAAVTVDQIERAIMGRTATAGAKAVMALLRGEAGA